jgi:diguanylate cyclase (GGDEF)-like protein
VGRTRKDPIADGRAPEERHEPSLLRRLLLAVAVTLLVSGGVAYLIVPRLIEERFVADQTATHAADARAIAREARRSPEPHAMQHIASRLEDIAARPGVEDALLVDRRGRVAAATDRARVGERDTERFARRAARRRGPAEFAEREQGELSYVAPVSVDGRRLALQVDRDDAELEQAIAELQVGLLLFILVGLPLALPVFYLVGGRRVNALHRAAVSRARRDGLTDLENHRAFQEELSRAVAESSRHRSPLELALIDVDAFKDVNDRHGHLHGDRLLVALAKIIAAGRESDRAFRLGGDEFALLLPRTDREAAQPVLERIRRQAPERLGGTTVSIGHAAAQPPGEDPDALWGRADTAVYEAKRRGGNCRISFDEAGGRDPVVTRERVRALRSLIDDGHMGVAFQPIWDLSSRSVLGFEALARPAMSHGFRGPLEAFQVAESTGHDQRLDAMCRAAALRRASELPADALLFLNLAPRALARSPGTAERLREAVEAVGIDPERVVAEVSERSAAAAAAIAPEAERLRELGFKVALDDVGAGNAGLEMLRELPVDIVKIDRGVVAASVEDRGARAVLVSIVSFAREIDAFVVAEGIESPGMLELVRRPWGPGAACGVHAAQGHLLGEPKRFLRADLGALERAWATA